MLLILSLWKKILTLNLLPANVFYYKAEYDENVFNLSSANLYANWINTDDA